MTHCPTCDNTRRVFNPDLHGYQNCPVCNVIHQDQGAAPAQPAAIEFHCTSAQTSPSDDYIKVIASGIEHEEILRQIPIAEAVKHYSPGDLLREIGIEGIKDYLNDWV